MRKIFKKKKINEVFGVTLMVSVILIKILKYVSPLWPLLGVQSVSQYQKTWLLLAHLPKYEVCDFHTGQFILTFI